MTKRLNKALSSFVLILKGWDVNMSILGTIVGSLSSIGAGNVVSNVAMKFVPANAGKFSKVLYALGIVGLSGAAGEAASNYMEKKIDDAVDAVRDIKNAIKVTKDGEVVRIAVGPEAVKQEETDDVVEVVESEAVET